MKAFLIFSRPILGARQDHVVVFLLGHPPDRPFHNSRSSKSTHQQTFCSLEAANDVFWGLQKCGNVGLGMITCKASFGNKELSLLSVVQLFCVSRSPTCIFTILEPLDQELGEFYAVWNCQSMGFETLKLWKGPSGRAEAISYSSKCDGRTAWPQHGREIMILQEEKLQQT